ncbi:serine/threonine-protein kinase [Myxococcus stipitatus]|uniref:serine/threonine protein kinase n=1 Tax=Myxococcus stipitatus TaxID=83455 RepID=UPI0030D580FA
MLLRWRGAGEEGVPIDFYRGERIGKYEVVTQLSVGGMAELFLGFTSGPGGFRKYVVIKRILPDVRDNAQFERMFLDEARITAAFNHPNIAQVFDLGQEDDGLYLAMEFIAGQNLNQLTGACLRRKQQVPLGFTLSVVRDVCMALHYAHTFTAPSGEPSPVIHRDVAQKNVMVTYDGVVKLLDFGIAKAKGSLERTHAGTVKGTTGYMSPEQVRGEKLDGRSDLFSVGVMMHEMLTGARLFAGSTERDEMMKILEAPIPWPSHVTPHVPEQVSRVVMQALERSREKRFANGRDMARAIEAAASSLIQDADHRASMMKELFAERMAATRALLESAEGTASSLMVDSAKRALRGDDGPYLPVREDTATPRSGNEPVPGKKPSRRVATVKKSQPPPEDETLTPAQRMRSNVLWGLLLLGILAGGGYGAVRLSRALDSTVEPIPEVPAYDSRLAVFPEPGDGGTVVAKKPAEPIKPAPSRKEQPADDDVKTERVVATRPGRATGKLSLNVKGQSAPIYLGKQRLGTMPLLGVELPAGKHTLRIVDPQGEKRSLVVVIAAGETTRLNFESWQDLQ